MVVYSILKESSFIMALNKSRPILRETKNYPNQCYYLFSPFNSSWRRYNHRKPLNPTCHIYHHQGYELCVCHYFLFYISSSHKYLANQQARRERHWCPRIIVCLSSNMSLFPSQFFFSPATACFRCEALILISFVHFRLCLLKCSTDGATPCFI